VASFIAREADVDSAHKAIPNIIELLAAAWVNSCLGLAAAERAGVHSAGLQYGS
jgi:hypothetical protein